MAMPPPSTSYGSRPAYMDNLFRDASTSKSQSLRSASSSISYASSSSSDLRAPPSHVRPPTTRPLSPRIEEEDIDDKTSVRSLRLGFSPRRSFRNLLNRRTYPQVKEMVDLEAPAKSPRWNAPTTWDGRPSPTRTSPKAMRRLSLPKLSTAFSASSPPNAEMYTSKPLPAVPSAKPTTPFTPLPKVDELRCQPCYYFAARNCNGYVFGGDHGDACENCLAAGFFGAS